MCIKGFFILCLTIVTQVLIATFRSRTAGFQVCVDAYDQTTQQPIAVTAAR